MFFQNRANMGMKTTWLIAILLWCATVFCSWNAYLDGIEYSGEARALYILHSRNRIIEQSLERAEKGEPAIIHIRFIGGGEEKIYWNEKDIIINKAELSYIKLMLPKQNIISERLEKKQKLSFNINIAVLLLSLCFTIWKGKTLFFYTPKAIKKYTLAKMSQRQTCPYCAERIKSEAIVCKHCGRDLPQKTG